jgi:hypothetical protein
MKCSYNCRACSAGAAASTGRRLCLCGNRHKGKLRNHKAYGAISPAGTRSSYHFIVKYPQCGFGAETRHPPEPLSCYPQRNRTPGGFPTFFPSADLGVGSTRMTATLRRVYRRNPNPRLRPKTYHLRTAT